MSSGAMTVVHGTPSLHILDHDVILDLLAIGTIWNLGVTGVCLTEILRASATQHTPHHPTCLVPHFAQDVPRNLLHLPKNPLRQTRQGNRRLHPTNLLSHSNQARDIFPFHKSHRKFCVTPQWPANFLFLISMAPFSSVLLDLGLLRDRGYGLYNHVHICSLSDSISFVWRRKHGWTQWCGRLRSHTVWMIW